MKKFIGMLVLALASHCAFAFTPATGMWWNPGESGRGYSIDQQNNIMYVTAYVYNEGGQATWFLATGKYNASTSTFSGQLGAYTGGQCLGCGYSKPSGTSSGTLTIVFHSAETATMNFPGGTTQIQHQVYGYANKTDYFLGEWAFTLGGGGLLSTQWVVFDGHYTGSDDSVFASGHEDGVSGTVALGAYYPSQNYFIVAVADNVGYTFEYVFPMGDDRRMLGLGTIYSTGTTPPQPTDLSTGSRLAFPAELSSGTSQPFATSETSDATGSAIDVNKLHRMEDAIRDLAQSYNRTHYLTAIPGG